MTDFNCENSNNSAHTAKNCVFCKIIAGEVSCDKIYEDDNVFVFLDINPVSKGHTLVITKQHYETIVDMPDDVLAKVIAMAKKVGKTFLVDDKSGFNLFQNNKPAAGQVVPHIHFHVIPRYPGDGHNFNWKGDNYVTDTEKEEYRKGIESALEKV